MTTPSRLPGLTLGPMLGLALGLCLPGLSLQADEAAIITTVGQAELVLAVDQLDLHVQFQQVASDSGAAMAALNEVAARARQALAALDLAPASSSTQITPNTQRRQQGGLSQTEIVSYTAAMTFKLDGLSSVQTGQAIDRLAAHQPANLWMSGQRNSQQQDLSLALPAQAATQARIKAEHIGRAYGCARVIPLAVVEGGAPVWSPQPRQLMMAEGLAAASAAPHQVEAGTITLTARVSGEFRLADCAHTGVAQAAPE